VARDRFWSVATALMARASDGARGTRRRYAARVRCLGHSSSPSPASLWRVGSWPASKRARAGSVPGYLVSCLSRINVAGVAPRSPSLSRDILASLGGLLLGLVSARDEAECAMAAVHALEPRLMGLRAHVRLIEVQTDDPVAPAPIAAQKDVPPWGMASRMTSRTRFFQPITTVLTGTPDARGGQPAQPSGCADPSPSGTNRGSGTSSRFAPWAAISSNAAKSWSPNPWPMSPTTI
jgi:hypothetical protein